MREVRTCPTDVRPVFLVLGLLSVASRGRSRTRCTRSATRTSTTATAASTRAASTSRAATPAYIDFAYYAFTIGMCFQVSDVTIKSPALRRTTLFHAVLSFAYNTVILAIALNFAIGTL
jgi:uncharacterized membrane protein